MNMLVVETGLSGHHIIRVKVSWTLVLEISLSDHHKIRVKVSWIH